MVKNKSFFSVLLFLLSLTFAANVALANSGTANVGLIDALESSMVTELSDQELNEVRAKAGDIYTVSATLQNFRFNLYTSTGQFLNQAQMVRLDNITGVRTNDANGEVNYLGFSVEGGAARAGIPENNYASFYIDKANGFLKIFDPTLVYWWPSMDILPRSDLGPLNGYNQISSALASTIEMFPRNDGVFGSGSWYQTRLVEVAAFWEDGSYITNGQIGGALVPGSTYNITMPAPFTTESQYISYALNNSQMYPSYFNDRY